MVSTEYFTHKVLKAGFNSNFYTHHINHIKSKSTITPKFFELEKIYVNNLTKEMAKIH